MPHHKFARTIAELDFHEDRILFPEETPQDIIGFCVGLTGKSTDPLHKRFLKITTRRIGINQEYTDIRREVGNLLLRLWDDKKNTMDNFWIQKPRDYYKDRDATPIDRIRRNNTVIPSLKSDVKTVDAAALTQDADGIFLYRVVEAFDPKLFKKFKPVSNTKTVAKTTKRPTFKSPIFVNGRETHEAPLLDIVRPTLMIFTMDSSFLKFVDDCVIPKKPSNRLNPYNRNLRLWFDRKVLGWYSHFDADTHKDGGEFWYDLVVQIDTPFNFKNALIQSFNGQSTFLADPGDGMGGGERFP